MEISFGRLGGAPVGRRRNRREAGRRKAAGRAWVLARLQEMDFLKYSGKAISGGRNRPRFAIQAHCGLLVTSVSPNCCLRYGILRKSHFLTQGSCEPMPFLAAFLRPASLRFLLLPTGVFNAPPELISMPFLFALLYVVMI